MPVDRGAIDAQLREVGEGERWWEQREFRDLPYILYEDERIAGLVLGRLLAGRRPRVRPAARWLLVATDQRLICLRHERFARRQVDISRGQFLRVRQSSGVRFFQITVETPDRRYRLRIPKTDALRFTAALAPLIPAPAVQRLGPEMEPLSWIPGIATVASLPGLGGIVSRVSMLSPPDYATRDDLQQLEVVVERLQGEVDRLQQQVGFLENLLQERAGTALPEHARDHQEARSG